MKTFITSDQHWGHANFLSFKDDEGNLIRPFSCVEEIDQLMIDNWNKVVRRNDKVYQLGDLCFSNRDLDRIMPQLNGEKVFIRGNHDKLKLAQYAKYFKDIRGSHRLDDMILSHIPLHPASLERSKGCIHGHIHSYHVLKDGEKDPMYFNACVEVNNYTPVDFEFIREYFKGNEK